jgi:hypothetical protein
MDCSRTAPVCSVICAMAPAVSATTAMLLMIFTAAARAIPPPTACIRVKQILIGTLGQTLRDGTAARQPVPASDPACAHTNNVSNTAGAGECRASQHMRHLRGRVCGYQQCRRSGAYLCVHLLLDRRQLICTYYYANIMQACRRPVGDIWDTCGEQVERACKCRITCKSKIVCTRQTRPRSRVHTT